MKISNKEKIFGSWWVFLSLIIFLNGLGLIFAGVRTKCKKWKIFGLIYIILAWVLMSLGFAGIYIVSWVVSIIHTMYIRKEYFIRIEVLHDSKDIIATKKETQDKKLVDKVYKDILGDDKHSFINKMETKDSKKIETKQTETVKTVVEPMQKLDINSCLDAELSQVPGIGIILSKKAMDIRKEHGKFTSLDEFYELLNISSEKRVKLDKCLECNADEIVKKFEKKENGQASETKNEEKFRNKNIGRKIDF